MVKTDRWVRDEEVIILMLNYLKNVHGFINVEACFHHVTNEKGNCNFFSRIFEFTYHKSAFLVSAKG